MKKTGKKTVDGFLIHHSNDLKFLQANKICAYSAVVHEDYINLYQKKNLKSFFNNPLVYQSSDWIKYITFNWYLSKKNIDFTEQTKFSIGDVLSTGLWIDLAAISREYLSLKYWTKKFKTLWISKNESKKFKHIAKKFKNIKFYNPKHNSKNILQSLSTRKLTTPPISKIASVGLVAQMLFQKRFRGRVVAINDWTYKKIAEKNKWLLINSRAPWKSAFFQMPNKYDLKKSSENWPKSLDSVFKIQPLNQVFKRIKKKIDSPLLCLLQKELLHRYKTYKKYFIFISALYDRLFRNYNPSELILPSDLYEEYAIAAKVAQQKKIKTSWLIDGYPYLHDITESYFLKRLRNNFDLVYLFSNAHSNAQKFKLQKSGLATKTICPPIFDFYAQKKIKPVFDIVICTWIAFDLSLAGRNGARPVILLDAIHAARACGIEKIAIKIKHNSEKTWLLPILKNRNIEAEVLYGPFYKYVRLAKVIIGGLSTAVAEASYHQIPYLIYEPKENGYATDYLKKISSVFSLNIYRNQKSLVLGIKKHFTKGD